MNPEKSIFWIATGIIFVFAGVMPTLTSQTDLAVEGIHPLGYPAYFGVMLTVSKMLGFLVITIPQIQRAVKEWAYAGLTFDFIAASGSDRVVDRAGMEAIFPMVVSSILLVSYHYHHKLNPDLK